MSVRVEAKFVGALIDIIPVITAVNELYNLVGIVNIVADRAAEEE